MLSVNKKTVDKKNAGTDKKDMADMDTHADNHADKPLNLGDSLKQAREKANLTQKEVALELKLSLNFVQLIEENKFDQLPSRVFARGYVRSYARLLKIPEADILACFDAEQCVNNEAQIQNLNQGISKLGRMDRKHFNLNRHTGFSPKLWLLLVVSAVLLTMLIFWLQRNAHKEDLITGVHEINSSYTISTGTIPGDIASTDSIKQPDDNLSEYDSAQSAVEDSLPSFNVLQTGTAQQANNEPDQQFQLAGLSDSSQPVTQEEPGETLATERRHRVKLSFDKEVWIEFKQENKVLKTGIFGKDEKIDLETQPPFSLIIGRADVANLTIDNKFVDLPSLAVNNVIRLYVGQATDLENYITY